MNEAATATAVLQDNEHIKALLSLLRDNRADTADLAAVLSCIGSMERKLDAAAVELTAMRRELSAMREQQDHPVRTALQKAVRALEDKIADARERLSEIKENIVGGCKNAVVAFREKGVSALHGVASFLHIRQGLEALRESMDLNIRFDDKALGKIATVSAEYHEIGRHVKNMGHALRGQERNAEAKEMGGLAKLVQAPYKLDKKLSSGIRRSVESALAGLSRLEQAAARQEHTAERPSVLENLQALKKQAAQAVPQTSAEQTKRQEAAL